MPGLSNRDLNNRITSRRRRINGGDYLRNHPLNQPPTVAAENHNGNLPALEILLISHAVVGGHEDLETRRLAHPEQVAVGNRSQPSCSAVLTVCASRKRAMGTGVP